MRRRFQHTSPVMRSIWRKRLLPVGLLAVGAFLLFAAHWIGRHLGLPDYEVVYLPTPDGTVTKPAAINNLGQVAGECEKADGTRAVLWDPAEGMIEIGTFGGTYSTATDLNDHGQVVGTASDPNGLWFAFIWSPESGLQNLGNLGGTGGSSATAINIHGHVCGWAGTGRKEQDGFFAVGKFFWMPDSGMQELDELSGRRVNIQAMNDQRQIVGSAYAASGPLLEGACAFRWSPNKGLRYLEHFDSASMAIDINSAGDVAGHAQQTENWRAFIWDAFDTVTELPLWEDRNVTALAINDQREVLLLVEDGGSKPYTDEQVSVLYRTDGTLVNLSRLFAKGKAFMAEDINNKGWIVGTLHEHDGGTRAVLLKPRGRQ